MLWQPIFLRSERGAQDSTIYLVGVAEQTKGPNVLRSLSGPGCSASSTARALLRAQGLLNNAVLSCWFCTVSKKSHNEEGFLKGMI